MCRTLSGRRKNQSTGLLKTCCHERLVRVESCVHDDDHIPHPLSSHLSRNAKIHASVTSEHECPHGWLFEISLRTPAGETSHAVTMSWRDHDYWCGGSIAPSRVVCAVIEYVAMHSQTHLPAKFDASTARRWAPHIDRELTETL